MTTIEANHVKYIFVTGGVLSGLGKGITAASVGNVLKERCLRVNMQKFDQYLNVDAGTLNPAEHGEVFVTDDGAETDLDLGHYERFLNQNLTIESSVMTGRIYQSLIARERRGEFLGKTVQVIPHVTNEVKNYTRRAATLGDFDVHIVEIGGTVGDDEGFHFIEAARQMHLDLGRRSVLYVHVVFLPYLKASDEVKTKPAQNSVRDLRSIGIQPDVLIARTDHALKPHLRRALIKKLSLYTNVEEKAILILPTLPSVYEVPLLMEQSNLHQVVADKLNLTLQTRLPAWGTLVDRIKQHKPSLTIALVGKYTTMLDTYASVVEALKAACWQAGVDLNLRWVDAEELEQQAAEIYLAGAAGIVVPGGFGSRGIEGKIAAIKYARERHVPYLGLCLGMQLAVIEFARHVAGIQGATSQEFDEDNNNTAAARHQWVIHLMEAQKAITDKGGTMRLGGWDCQLTPGTTAFTAYQPAFAPGSAFKQAVNKRAAARGEKRNSPDSWVIRERHRHRYEFNNAFKDKLEQAGLRIAGTTEDGQLVEIVEVADHPWFVGVQYHAEFTSRPTVGHPLFNAFVQAALKTMKTATTNQAS